LLTKPEQCSEACRLFIHLLTGVTIRWVLAVVCFPSFWFFPVALLCAPGCAPHTHVHPTLSSTMGCLCTAMES
jgi:hypothetical protein